MFRPILGRVKDEWILQLHLIHVVGIHLYHLQPSPNSSSPAFSLKLNKGGDWRCIFRKRTILSQIFVNVCYFYQFLTSSQNDIYSLISNQHSKSIQINHPFSKKRKERTAFAIEISSYIIPILSNNSKSNQIQTLLF